MNLDRLLMEGIRWIAWPSITVNATTMTLSALSENFVTMFIGCGGAAASLYAWLYYLDERDNMPEKPITYRNLATRLRYEIVEERAMRPGQKVDSVKSLAERFGTTRVTVSRALKVLAREGLIEVVHGRGTYVLGDDGWRDDRVKDHIERALITHPSGERIPHTQQLVVEFGTTYSTVRRVQRNLSTRGVIVRQPDGGYVRA